MKFNEKLKILRKDQGLYCTDVAAYLYVEPRAVRSWEKGLNYPSAQLLMAISKFYDVSMDELLTDDMAELPITPVAVQAVIPELKFGEKIYMMRKQLKIRQAVMCDRMGVSVTSLERWESCEVLPSTQALMKVSKFFGVPIEELLFSEKEEA